MNHSQKHEQKPCPRCGHNFECKVGDIVNCQCNDIKLSEEVYQLIAEKYQGCICGKCLKALSDKVTLFTEKMGGHPR